MLKKKSQKGQGLIEYLIIVALVAVGAIAIMRDLSQSENVKLAQIARSLGAKPEGDLSAPEITDSMVKKKDLKDFMNGSIGRDNKD
jgi:pilus assembly protein Flp/PilA